MAQGIALDAGYQHPTGTRWRVFAVVVGCHVFVFLQLIKAHVIAFRSAARASAPIELIFLPSSKPAESPRAVWSGAPSVARPTQTAQPRSEAKAADRQGSITLPIDWSQQAKIAAQSHAQEIAQSAPCDLGRSPDQKSPQCQPDAPGFQWKTTRRSLHIGHCIIGIGFFGCGAAAARVNGNLFDDMRNPDRDRSSVPDLAEINEPISAHKHRSVLLPPP